MPAHFKKLELETIENTMRLIGGFSATYSAEIDDDFDQTNNCHGGNCLASSCSKQKKPDTKGTNKNCKGNCVKGCGKPVTSI